MESTSCQSLPVEIVDSEEYEYCTSENCTEDKKLKFSFHEIPDAIEKMIQDKIDSTVSSILERQLLTIRFEILGKHYKLSLDD